MVLLPSVNVLAASPDASGYETTPANSAYGQASGEQATDPYKAVSRTYVASTLMESWLAWGCRVCGNEELLEHSRARIESAQLQNLDALDSGLVYLNALEGDVEKLMDPLRTVFTERHTPTVFAKFFSNEFLV